MIKVTGLNKSFGKLQVIKNFSFTGEAGQCIALLGPNGCGKTTFIKSILGMVIPNSGEIYVKDKKVNKGWTYRKDIGYMPQIGHYPENMRIGHLLDMLNDIRKHSDRTDDEIIKSYKLDAISNKRMGTLSGGTMQKVSAAIAFMFNPDILILDEPTAGLDPVSSEILKEKILKELANKKMVIITSHILSELDGMASDVVYMQNGEALFNGSVNELKSDTGEEKLTKAIARFVQNLN